MAAILASTVGSASGGEPAALPCRAAGDCLDPARHQGLAMP